MRNVTIIGSEGGGGGGTGTSPSAQDQNLIAEVATAVGDPITLEGITSTPVGRVDVYVNSQRWMVGDGVKTLDCYFSSDGGTTARAMSAIESLDGCYLGTAGAVVGTTLSDTISFCYNT